MSEKEQPMTDKNFELQLVLRSYVQELRDATAANDEDADFNFGVNCGYIYGIYGEDEVVATLRLIGEDELADELIGLFV